MKRINRFCERANKRTNRLVAKLESEKLRSTAKTKSEELTSANNSRNLPGNATIRKEYVRCGKLNCASKHGPYYYAYWKDDSGKLTKKYIGKYRPAAEKTNKDNPGHKDHASKDIVIDDSESPER
jgi:hypothetical protein